MVNIHRFSAEFLGKLYLWGHSLCFGSVKRRRFLLSSVQPQLVHAPFEVRTGMFPPGVLPSQKFHYYSSRSFSLKTRHQYWVSSFTILDRVTQLVTGVIN
jgi:hypothetical protein